MNRSPEIRRTRDGSTTLYSGTFDQHYHNPNGAWSESLYVFFETPGLIRDIQQNRPLVILETGFGTGLNFIMLASLLIQHGHSAPVQFHSVEAFPISAETAAGLDFGDEVCDPALTGLLPDIFGSLHMGPNRFRPFGDLNLDLHLYHGSFGDWKPAAEDVQYFFHDPFSPEANPELWTETIFLDLLAIADSEAMLATYCAASSARAAMAAAGWKVARAAGALGKREMTLASPSPSKLEPWKRLNEERLTERLRAGDFS